jgi:hypothetical protein
VKIPLISFTTVTGVRVSHWQITSGSPPLSFSIILLTHFSGFHPSLNFVKHTKDESEVLELYSILGVKDPYIGLFIEGISPSTTPVPSMETV